MVIPKAASLSCVGFICGMCWLVSEVATPLTELATPLVMDHEWPAGAASVSGASDAGGDGVRTATTRFDRPTPIGSITPRVADDEAAFAVVAPAVTMGSRALPSPVNDSAAPVIVDLDVRVQDDLPQLVEGDSGPAARPVPEAVVVESAMSRWHLLAAVTPGDAGAGVTPENQAARPPAPREYTVKPGDSLGKIARRFLGVDSPETIAAIVRANPDVGDRRDKIFVGEVLAIPATHAQGAGQDIVKAAAPGPARASARDYTIRPGDSLVGIARRLLRDGDRWREIAVLNDLSNADKIIPGMRIMLPPVRNDT